VRVFLGGHPLTGHESEAENEGCRVPRVCETGEHNEYSISSLITAMTLPIYDSGAGTAAQEQKKRLTLPPNVPAKSVSRDILEGISISLPVFRHLRGREASGYRQIYENKGSVFEITQIPFSIE
jgi:hypothetical protein